MERFRIVPLPENGALLDHGAFVDAAIAADENIVFHNDGNGADGFENAADLRSSGDVTVLADLRAAANQGVRIDHGAIVNISADVDVHGRHASDTAADVAAIANAGAAGNDADAVLRGEMLERIG